MKIPVNLKNKESCIGCPIYLSANIFESRICEVSKGIVVHEEDGTFYGHPVRPEICKINLGE